ncbi:MAG: hypothetical protein RIQ68_1212, partial [Pseudomonadota bacterium]
MQTLGLNLATAAPDAGADSALQSTAAAPSGAGAIFEILMTAAGAGTPDLSISPDATAQAVGAYPADAVTAAPDPLMQALAGASTGIATGLDASGNQTNKFGADLASDMENMVQALAITAEVVAQGMAARTTPVREIILTVETPNSETPADPALPNLNIVVPAPTDTGLTLKVSEADPDKNLDPALLALMPQISPTPAAATQVDDVAANGPDLLAAPVEPAPDAPIVAEIPAAQAVSTAMEETYGPWRAEIYGPVLNDRRELIPGPVHVPIFEPPASVPQSASLPSADADIPQMTDAPLLDEPALLTKPDASPANTLMGAPIRVVTIHVPAKAVTPPEAEAEDDETGTDILAVTPAAPADKNAVKVTSAASMDV